MMTNLGTSTDMSVYTQYFKARNGTYKRVPQVANLGLGVQAGVTVYYIRGYQSTAKVTAFKPVGSKEYNPNPDPDPDQLLTPDVC